MNVKWLAAVVTLVALPALAQPAAVVPPRPGVGGGNETSQQRFQMRIMEGVLENAVQHGAQSLSTQLRLVSPDIALFSGPARARGFRLDGYGMLFAVDVPALLRSVTWSVQKLTQSNGDVVRALQSLKRMIQAQRDGDAKSELERSLRLIEVQVGPPARSPLPGGAMVTAASVVPDMPAQAAAAPAPVDVPAVVADPNAAYTDAVKTAMIDAMLDYGTTLNLPGDEWLTIAARENTDSILSGDLTESVTVTLRVKAGDLAAFKAGRLTREEARRRVEVRES